MKEPMTIKEIKQAKGLCQAKIREIIQLLEEETMCRVEGIRIERVSMWAVEVAEPGSIIACIALDMRIS